MLICISPPLRARAYAELVQQSQALARFTAAPVARLATVTATGAPHLVPVVFAVADDVIYTAVDGKPKSTTQLRRLENITMHPRVALLVDHYASDWSRLWWVRVDGSATVHTDSAVGRTALRSKYPQYQTVSLDGPVIVIDGLR